MSEYDEDFDDTAYIEVVSDGVVYRMPVTAEQPRCWVQGKQAIGLGRGEPST